MKHNLTAPLKFTPPVRRTFAAISIALSLVFALAAFGAIGTSWTYQGQLRRSGAAYTGTCSFQFSLWSAESGGAQVGTTWTQPNINVVNGLFTVPVDFGAAAFEGQAQWLQTAVLCSGDGGLTQLNPRQLVAATPYALNLRPGARIMGDNDITAFESTGQTGVKGICNWITGNGVYGLASVFDSIGVYGENLNGVGVKGSGRSGVYGVTSDAAGSGVSGLASGANAAGVFGQNSAGAGVWGRSTGNGSAIYGEAQGAGYAGRFIGPVHVQGNLTKLSGAFQIDHPLDPANKFLSHSFVESPDMMNIYNGNVTTDANGSAAVTLPDYFAALNRDYRYQLTVVGQFAQAIVSRKVAQNSFEIRTDKPGVEVSWQVTGIRQDAFAKAHPIVVDEFKPAEQKGLYLYPAGFGAGEEKGIGYPSRPATAPGEREAPAAGSADQARSK